MKSYLSKCTAILSSLAVAFYAVTPAFAATDVLMSGNGAASTNTATSTTDSSRVVNQSNSFTGATTITASPNSGNNTVSNQTGGSTTVGTGNVSSTVQTVTQANLNQLQDNRLSSDAGLNLGISGNGALSSNAVTTTNNSTDSVFQNNAATLSQTITADPSSGNNSITNGTGGSETLVSGHAASVVGLQTQVNGNLANLGQNQGVGSTTTTGTTALISGNGAGSFNTVDLSRNRVLTFVQNNTANVDTAVDASPTTGNNSISNDTQSGLIAMTPTGFMPLSTTGGGERIDTGNATSTVAVSTMANVNSASNGGADQSLNRLVLDGNGAFSSNTFSNSATDALSLFQGAGENAGTFNASTAVTADPFSGYNNALNNTLQAGDSSLLVTGHAMSDTRVNNQGNVNSFGPSNVLTLPGGTSVGFNFNLGGLLGMFR